MRRTRLDRLLVKRGLFPSREQARQAILAGQVLVDGAVAAKAGMQVAPHSQLRCLPQDQMTYVSRGGKKLEHALAFFRLDVQGAVAVDIGASTGGFTDCLLRNGARKVVAVDVGYGQLAWKLRQDPRVRLLERTNARYLEPSTIGEPVDIVTIDVSFISLRLILSPARRLLATSGRIVSLVKPQFEAGRHQVGKGGVVRSPDVHREVLERVIGWGPSLGLSAVAATPSPLTGPKGNREFFLLWSPAPPPEERPPRIDLDELFRESPASEHCEQGRTGS